ncbi:MAG: hypothetical protein RI953_1682 [Pseudomonadota bacterium]|jgi:hypothetical protein
MTPLSLRCRSRLGIPSRKRAPSQELPRSASCERRHTRIFLSTEEYKTGKQTLIDYWCRVRVCLLIMQNDKHGTQNIVLQDALEKFFLNLNLEQLLPEIRTSTRSNSARANFYSPSENTDILKLHLDQDGNEELLFILRKFCVRLLVLHGNH